MSVLSLGKKVFNEAIKVTIRNKISRRYLIVSSLSMIDVLALR